MFDTETKELVKKTLKHEGEQVREFLFRIAASGAGGDRSHRIVSGLAGGIADRLPGRSPCGNPRGRAHARQKFDGRDALLLLRLQIENRFPSIWVPSRELRDLHALLRHRHQWVRMRTRVQNALQAIAVSHGLRRGPSLW